MLLKITFSSGDIIKNLKGALAPKKVSGMYSANLEKVHVLRNIFLKYGNII